MSFHFFFIAFLMTIALTAFAAILFFIVKPQKKSIDKISSKEIKIHFEDAPLQKSIQNIKEHLLKNYQCFKCKERRYETNPFDADLFEVYCQKCGLKRFYHIDLLAGLQRVEKKICSPWVKEWNKNFSNGPCPDCKGSEYSEFKMLMDVKNKIGGFGDRKKIELYLCSCKNCGLVTFYDRMR